MIFDQTSAISATICESGVLDMKVVKNIVCVALSTGGLVLYKVVNAFNLELHASTCEPDEGLFLSIDVDNKLLDTCWEVATKIAVSTQLGSILIYEYIPSQHDENVILRKTGQISGAHSMFGEVMPAWIVFFDPHSKCRLISGGDDCVMKMWNLLTEAESSTVADTFLQIYETPAASNRKAHTAGVTSGQWHPHFRHLFASGSYDEHVRIWDGRDFSRPLLDIYTGKFVCFFL